MKSILLSVVAFLATSVTTTNAYTFPQNPLNLGGIDVHSFINENLPLEPIHDLEAYTALVASWKELLVEFGPKRLVQEIADYKERVSSFPGTQQSSKKSATANANANANSFQRGRASADYEVVSNAKFSGHSLRIKDGNPEALHLDTVKQYTGYLDIEEEDKHLFYWFFESRNDPKTDPILLWLNGGPGCSSLTGLFFELGPSSISHEILPVYNPYSWNSNASVIFLDQPVGVGYSHSSGKVSLTAAAGEDVYAFLELFFQKFPQFRANKFHISGELYAGHYIPKFASEIISHDDRSFDLASVLIGNGITDPLIQTGSYRPMLCGEGGVEQKITDEECLEMDKQYEKCIPAAELCYKFSNPFSCVPAGLICGKVGDPFGNTGLNPYDLRRECDANTTLCYADLNDSAEFLNSEYIKYVLGVDDEVKEYESCSSTVGVGFFFTGDLMKPHQQYVTELLELGIPVLLYSGDKDYICNWIGNKQWSDALPYSDHESFLIAPTKPYHTKTQKHSAGEVKNYDIFTYLRVYDAGHMVPYDQPEIALDMLNTWLSGDYSFSGKK